MPSIICSRVTIDETLRLLQFSGKNSREGIVLWLGHHNAGSVMIRSVYQPAHRAKADMFHIYPESMSELKNYLRANRLFIAAQIHSHPFKAFHSQADNKWAIIRHTGALSIVVPYFALQTTPQTFFHHAAAYVLSKRNFWEAISQKDLERLCRMV